MRELINLVEGILTESSRASLEAYFGNESNFNFKSERDWKFDGNYDPEDEDDEGVWSFPSGGQWFICTDWSCYARRFYGDRVKLFGFMVEDNPESEGLVGFEGHDFAVLDDRYIIDGWLKAVEDFAGGRCVFDMQDPQDAQFIRRFYGDPKKWTHNTNIEQRVDRETPEQRALAMRGVAKPPSV